MVYGLNLVVHLVLKALAIQATLNIEERRVPY